MAQTIDGAMLVVSQNFEDAQSPSTEWVYANAAPYCDMTSNAWGRVDTIGTGNSAITQGSNSSLFWGAWNTGVNGCGDTGSEEELFFTETIPLGNNLAEICFDYNVGRFNGRNEYLDIEIESSNGDLIETNIITGSVNASEITTNGWVKHCESICLDAAIETMVYFSIVIRTEGAQGWLGIDNIELFTSTELDIKECLSPPFPNTDIAAVCDTTPELFRLYVRPGVNFNQVSWELRNEAGERIDYVNADTEYTNNNNPPYQRDLTLYPCERYQFVVFDGSNNGWEGGFWTLVNLTNNNKRGWESNFNGVAGISGTQYQLDWGDGGSFSDMDTSYWSLPCMPECPESLTFETDTECSPVNYIPEPIEPIICPNTCIEPTMIRVQVDEGDNNSIDTTLYLPVSTGVDLGVGVHRAIYEVIYEDGQIVRCTTEINVVVQINPAIACNDNVVVALNNYPSCRTVITPDMVLEDFIDCSNEYIVNIIGEDGNNIGNVVTDFEVGQTLVYTVRHIHSDNYCWGTITIEDKLPPILNCFDEVLSCNNPAAFQSNVNNFNTYFGESSELPANIAGGTFNNPSVTTLALFSDVSCAMTNEIVKSISLDLRIIHTDLEDLSATLIAPNGLEVELLDRPCQGRDNQNLEAVFRDNGNNITCNFNTTYSVSGSIRPAEENGQANRGFSKFNGIPLDSLNGVWILKIYDSNNSTAGSDNEVGTGELQVARLEINSTFKRNFDVFDCSDPVVSMLDETVVDLSCNDSDGLGAQIVRIWQAEDDFGNISTCEQVVSLLAPDFSDLLLPPDISLQCGSPSTGTGSTITGLPVFDCNDILPMQHTLCDVSYAFEDELVPLCGNTFKTIRTWTIINWCSGVTHYHEQVISVIDTQIPTITRDTDYTIVPDTFDCTASVVLQTGLSDNCSDSDSIALYASYTLEEGIHNEEGTLVIVDLTNTDTIPHLPVGTTFIRLHAVDECGNEYFEDQNLNVTDEIPPIALCYDTTGMNTEIPPIHISLGSDGTAKVFVNDIDYGSYDNCGVDRIQIRREDGCGPNDTWSEDATFYCCDEANNPIILNLRVTDAQGNKAVCQREVYVEDPHPPVIICAPNDTIYCEDAAIAESLFQEPNFSDNCPVTIQTTTITDIDPVCLSGTIERTWVASDLSPKSPDVSCTQTIIVIHNSDFVVQFPADTLITDCPDSLLIIGEPIISDLDCEFMAIGYEDQIFDIVPDACYKIERHWTVINECIFSSAVLTGTGSIITSAPGMVTELPTPRTFQDDNVGKIEYTQIIKVLDSKPPFFDCPSDTLICDEEPTCMREIRLKPIVSDNCSPLALELQFKIDLDDNGTFDIVEIGSSVEGFYPYGTHRIQWIAEDGCGNTADCSYLFTIQDCFAPTPVCTNGLSITIAEGECAPIWASDFLEYATDNCTESGYLNNSVKIRLEGENEPLQPSILLCCESAGINEVEIWVTDEAGNSDFCLTYIDVQNNDGGCEGEDELASIAGRIETSYGDWVENVVLLLNDNEASQLSQDEGFYLFNAMSVNNNYSLHASKTNHPTNGVSTFDLVLMTQHILAIAELQSPYQLIAADVNNDGNVTTFDVVQLRQLILFLIQDFPANTSWRFVDADYMFPNPLNPWQEAFPEYISFSPLSGNELQTDFVGIKIGDIDGSATANNLMDADNRSESTEVFALENTSFAANAFIEIPFALENRNSLTGFQFSLELDTNRLEYLGFENDLLELNNSNINVLDSENGYLHFSWNTAADALTNIQKESLFKLQFKTKQSGTLRESLAFSDRHLAPEVYFNNTEKSKLDLAFAATESSPTAPFQLYQNQPNPFSDKTVIAFYLPTASHTHFQIFDLNGHAIYQSEQNFPKGKQQITLSANEFPTSGVYYYQLTRNGFTASQSLVVVK